ncbi:transcription factor bHLH143-like [Impatiens glandulifera]|uniref:transcription factor bHLH143-like n=1 Tax=Impatiens glandulifera TaxID=253017 RepID=UPI001FB0CB94|nr:transcription factor bHLH143-like [Impatiens glandulifera]
MEKSLGTCSSHQLSAFRPPLPLQEPEPFAISANELNSEYLGCSYRSPQLIEALNEKMKVNEYLPASGFLQKKRFLVFDQCGNRTTLVSPAYLTWCWHDLNYKSGTTAGNNNSITCLSSDHRDESEDNNNTHEDTEEIDALLYSDDDDGDDDEEASTGRSPSFTRGDNEEEEVTSSARSTTTKRIKLSESTWSKV